MIENLSSGTLRARLWHSLVDRGATEATLASHVGIYSALVARDAERAAAADLMHLGPRRTGSAASSESRPPTTP